MVTTTIQNNFVGGEISPSLHGRSDLKFYYTSAAHINNFIVGKEGSLRKRRGIITHGSIAGFTASPRVFAYRYDRDQGGVLLIGNRLNALYVQLRDKTDLGDVLAEKKIYDATLIASQLKKIRATQIGDTFFLNCQGVFNKKLVVGWADRTLIIDDYSQSAKPDPPSSLIFTKSGSASTERTIYYAAFIVKDGVYSNRLSRSIGYAKNWPAGGYIDATIYLTNSDHDFDYVLLTKKTGGNFEEVARWYPEDITGNSVLFHDENIIGDNAIYTQTNTLGDDWTPPLCTSAFQQRLVFANTSKYPMTLWFSEIGNLYNFYANRPAADNDAFSPTIHATGPAFIRWLVTYQKSLIAMTDCGVYSIIGSNAEGFSARTCQITKISEVACSTSIQPIETGAGVIFVGSDDKTLYTMAYDIQDDSTLPINQMQLAEHLVRGCKIESIALQQFPYQVVWCVLSDGSALSFTYEKKQEVAAWAHHSIANAKIVDVLNIGSVTDSTNPNDGRTYSDIVFRLVNDGDAVERFAVFRDGIFSDSIAGGERPVVATLQTLRAEAQDRTIAGVRKNVKDVHVRINESGPIKVLASNSNLVPQTLNADNEAYTGVAKAAPLGYINDDGQMTFVSDGATNCEITTIVYRMEVDG